MAYEGKDREEYKDIRHFSPKLIKIIQIQIQ